MSKPESLECLGAKLARLRVRQAALAAVRGWFETRGFVEVETPLLVPAVAPEEHIAPVRCGERFLATSPELQMKMLCAAGLERCFQVTRSFRAGERGTRHAPEFTILEWYRPGRRVEDLVSDLEGFVAAAAAAVHRGLTFRWQGREVDVRPPWEVVPVREAFLRHAGWDPVADFDADRFDLDLADKVEPMLGRGRPQVLAWYPAALGSLARLHPDDRRLALRAELYIEGIELANGFVELADAEEQRARFERAREAIRRQGREPPPMPEPFLAALAYLPETVGMALGVDRLVMLLADAGTVADVMAFGPDDMEPTGPTP